MNGVCSRRCHHCSTYVSRSIGASCNNSMVWCMVASKHCRQVCLHFVMATAFYVSMAGTGTGVGDYDGTGLPSRIRNSLSLPFPSRNNFQPLALSRLVPSTRKKPWSRPCQLFSESALHSLPMEENEYGIHSYLTRGTCPTNEITT